MGVHYYAAISKLKVYWYFGGSSVYIEEIEDDLKNFIKIIKNLEDIEEKSYEILNRNVNKLKYSNFYSILKYFLAKCIDKNKLCSKK